MKSTLGSQRASEPGPRTVTADAATATRKHPFSPFEQSGRIRVLLVDDHPVVTQGLSALFAAQPDLEVVGVANDTGNGLRMVDQLRPDVMLIDAQMPGMTGAETMRWLRRSSQHKECAVIFFTNSSNDGELLNLIKLGARGLVLKDSPVDLVLKSIRKVHAGEFWIGRQAMAQMAKALTASDDDGGVQNAAPVQNFGLTERERTVLRQIVKGDTNAGIAKRLGVSENTIKHHLTNTFNKTGTSNRLELALFALHHRIVPLS